MTIFLGRNGRLKIGNDETYIKFNGYEIEIKGSIVAKQPKIHFLPKTPEGGDNVRYNANKWMSHTNMRFDTMSLQKLWTRMGKTTNPDKLMAFSIVAEERGHMDLAIAAKARIVKITGDQSVMSDFAPKKKDTSLKKNGKRLMRRLDL